MGSVDKKFIVNLQGKEFVTYEGLLDLAHQMDLTSITTNIVQFPSAENNNQCIMKATAITGGGKHFEGHGDADPSNVNKMIAKHLIRMAETRAKARALRDLTNIGMTAIEELGEESVAPIITGKQGNEESEELKCSSCGAEINQAVSSYSKKHFNKELCRDCQAKEKK